MPNPNARRRNLSGQFESLPAAGRTEPVPELPTTYSNGAQSHPKFKDETRAAWDAWWRSPMATTWAAADLPTVIRMAVLHDQALRGTATGVQFRELRMLEDRFGLSPKARRTMRWAIEEAGDQRDRGDGTVVLLRVPDADDAEVDDGEAANG